MPPRRTSVKRTVAAAIEVTPGPMQDVGSRATVTLSVPSLPFNYKIEIEFTPSVLTAFPNIEEGLLSLGAVALGDALSHAVVTVGLRGTIPDPLPPPIDASSADYFDLKTKYDRLLCSSLGILHD